VIDAGTCPKLAVYKFSSCDGCQLSILNLEDELLELVNEVNIAYFLEASSEVQPGPYDLALVEGSISTEHEVERIHRIRKETGFLIAMGTCATAGGIQALRNFSEADEFTEYVYPHPEFIEARATSTPIAEHVPVDFQLWGCPVDKRQLVEVLAAALQKRKPRLPVTAVCAECKRAGIPCVTVARGTPCLGPITRSGCGALCPAKARGCYGCFGPVPGATLGAMIPVLLANESQPGEAARLLRHVSCYAPGYREAHDLLFEVSE
jgi:coenzyme F420-reducing hydrogenase gamma subunit